ncbi:MAG: hypothetical protein ACOYOU_00140 [Kiritimatiellia bacterium]
MAKKFIVRKKTAPSDAAGVAAAAAEGAPGEPHFPRIADFAAFVAELPAVAPLTCPACHATFQPEAALFIAHHASLPHDLLLGPGNPYRFRPTRFTPAGEAVDPCGELTADTACPACHAALWPSAAPAAAPAAAPQPPRTAGAARDKNAPEILPPQLSTIEGIRQLVTDIQALVNRTGTVRLSGDVCSRQYAELCRRTNARLELCKYFIRNHQPGAAIDQSAQQPPLLELCNILPFPDLSQWGQLCARSRWAVPEPVDNVAMAEVQSAMRNAQTVEPALDALRAAVRRDRPDAALRVLRTLMQTDPSNPIWREDVEQFEVYRQRDLLAAATAAIEAEDVATLTAPALELTGPWLIPPDPEMRDRVKVAFDRLRRMDAAQRGGTYAAQFAEACAAKNYDAAAAADTALKALHAEGFYQPQDAARQLVEAGQGWFAAEYARIQADAVFARDLAALEASFEKPEGVDEIERLRNALRSSGRKLPADLQTRADRIIQQHQFRILFRKRLVLSAKLASAGVVLVLLVLLGCHLGLAHQRKFWISRMEQALKAENLDAFDESTSGMSSGFSRLFGTSLTKTPAIQALRVRRDELATRMQSRSASYQSDIAKLQQIQANRFEAPAVQVLDLVVRAKQAALTMDDMAAIERFETPWRADQNVRLAQALVQLPALTLPATNIFVAMPFAAATQQVAQYCAQVDAAAGLLGANKEDLAKVTPFVASAQLCRSNLTSHLAALQPADSAPTLNSYLDVLVRYTDLFPNDALSVPLAAILNSRREYRASLQVTADLQGRFSVIATNTAWPQARRAMLDNLRDNKYLNNLRWARRKDTGELLFLVDREKPEPGTHGKWANCYLPMSGDTDVLFQRARVTDDLPYRLGFSDIPSRSWHHTELVNDLLARAVPIEQAEDGARFLEETFRRIGTSPVWNGIDLPGSNDMPNVAFQIQFLVFLADHLARLSPLPEWRLILDELNAADIPQAKWICLKNGDVKRINQEGAKTMAIIFGPGGLLTRLNIRRAANALVARTPMVWAGHVDFADASHVRWVLPAPPASFIVLRPDAQRVRMIAIDAGSPANPRLPLIPGEPVLAWSDGASTAAKTAEIGRSVNLPDPATITPLVPTWYPTDPVK